ncbi:ATP-dependent DNA helicase [Hydrogenophaga sp. PAMC20947]|nr:ATP-dependent DNA helicase [Hydrogenophaga sp. PAMC20947]
MAVAVAETLDACGVLVVEAGTGVGKTFAYLAPLLLGGRRALVSTATQALQDQLFHRDIPALTAWLGLPVRAALLKGRASYVCVHRVDLARRGEMGGARLDPAHAAALEHVHRWATLSAQGDLAELPGLDDNSPLRPWITSTRDNCQGSQCPRVADCHVNRARASAMAADWVVVNHHLFFADHLVQAEGLAELLPGVDAVVLDEAHRVNDIGLQVLGRSVGARDLQVLARELRVQGERWARGLQPWGHCALLLEQAAQALDRHLRPVLSAAARVRWTGSAPQGVDPLTWSRDVAAVSLALAQAARVLESAADAAEPLRRLHGFAHQLSRQWRALGQATGGTEQGVRWVDSDGSDGPWRLRVAFMDAAHAFHRLFEARSDSLAWVFTSATLGTEPELRWFTEPLRLAEDARTRCLRLDSPLDHARLGRLFVPTNLPSSSDAQHSRQLAAAVARWAERLGGCTLVLTTSLKAMQVIGEVLQRGVAQGQCGPLRVLVQGQMSKRALLAGFRQAGEGGGPGAVLVASMSFWEGVDLVGDSLQLLVIDKLPFPAPDDPLMALRAQRAEDAGGSVFRSCHLPQAAMALKQGAGRLIRSETDRGVLVVADDRLLTRSYGPELLAALPPMSLLESEAGLAAELDRLRLTRASTRARSRSSRPN